MAALTPISAVFNGGELSPLMKSRVDQTRYQNGCLKLYNAVCLAQGGVTRRPGMRFLGEAGDQVITNPVRVVDFVFSTTESRVMEFGVGYVRIWSGDDLIMDSGSPYEVVTPYTAADIEALWFTQSADVVYIASKNHRPAKLSRYADDDWRYEVIEFMPQTEVPTGLTATKNITLATDGQKTYKYCVTAIDATDGEESIASETVSITSDILNSIDGNTITLDWDANTVEPLEYRVYKMDAGVFGYIGTVDGAEVSPSFIDTNIGADTEDAPPKAEDPFEDAGYHPGINFMWQQRLGWTCSYYEPFTVRLSPSAQFESMASSSPPADSDAITQTLAARRANSIQWVAEGRALILGTTGNEWSMGGTDGEVLTPKDGFRPQGAIGSEAIPALTVGASTLYVQRGGKVVREFSYTYASDQYNSADTTIVATHLFDERVVQGWCYQQAPFSTIWTRTDDGKMPAMTMLKEHEVIGWHFHETAGQIESICSVPGPDYDRVYMSVIRNIDGVDKRFIERFDDFFINQTDPADAFFIDSGVTYDGVETDTLAGIAPHLAGETVKIWADGAEQAEQVVGVGGDVNLQTSASKVSLGLGFDSIVVPTRPEIVAEQGTSVGRVMKVTHAILRLFKSMSVWAGRSADELEDVLMHDAADPENPQLASGDYESIIATGWDEDWEFTIKASGPAPMTLLSVTYSAEIGEEL